MASGIIEVLKVVLGFLSKPIAVIVVAVLTVASGAVVVLAPHLAVPLLVVEVAKLVAAGGLGLNLFQTASGAKAKEEVRDVKEQLGPPPTTVIDGPKAPPVGP